MVINFLMVTSAVQALYVRYTTQYLFLLFLSCEVEVVETTSNKTGS